MSIQGSVNQLLGTVAAGANLMNREFSEQRKAAAGLTDAALGRLESTGAKKIPGGPTLQEVKDTVEGGRAELGGNLIDNLKAVKAEQKTTNKLND